MVAEKLQEKRGELARLEKEIQEMDAQGQMLNKQLAELQQAIPTHNAKLGELHAEFLRTQGAIAALLQLVNEGEGE
jgi:septal ring factor EnvC (AmiA/AmiB activator)